MSLGRFLIKVLHDQHFINKGFLQLCELSPSFLINDLIKD